MPKDRAKKAVEQWRRELPDIDPSAMAIGRPLQAAKLIERDNLNPDFACICLQKGEFDVLASLLRSGAPYELTPTELYEALMLSSVAMTSRIDRIEQAGLVERRPDPDDRRGTRVRLLPGGRKLIDRVLVVHLANEEAILSRLTAAERNQPDKLLAKLIASLPKRS
jgi:DNA-binding MarR family transcriptional regulator